MGLDSFIRKISKTKLLKYTNCDLQNIPGYYHLRNETFYWRNHHVLNHWMLELSAKQLGPKPEAVMNGAPIFLREPDLISLKFEMMFNPPFQEYWADYYYGLHSHEKTNPAQTRLNEDLSRLDHLIRVSRRGRSVIFYTASW